MPILALLAALALPAPAPAPASLMGPGVSEALARQCAARIRDVRYDLVLDVTGRDTATGRVVVRFERTGPGDVILDFRGPWVGPATVNGRSAPAEQHGAHLRIPARALRDGANEVELVFHALMAPAGASIIRYRDVTDGSDYLYTLLVPADANQLFPCFDQPDLKARVTLTLTTPVTWTAVANGITQRVDTALTAGGAAVAVHHFRESEPISTYLIAFAAGPWVKVTSQPRAAGASGADGTRALTRPEGTRPIALDVRASRAKEADADTLIAINRRAAEWLERYFERPFPLWTSRPAPTRCGSGSATSTRRRATTAPSSTTRRRRSSSSSTTWWGRRRSGAGSSASSRSTPTPTPPGATCSTPSAWPPGNRWRRGAPSSSSAPASRWWSSASSCAATPWRRWRSRSAPPPGSPARARGR